MLIETLEFLKDYIHQVFQYKVTTLVLALQLANIQLSSLARLYIPKLDE